MKHYSSEEWIDFTNASVPQPEREAMQLHLDSGCGDCRDIAETWKQVRDAARREPQYQIPVSVVRYVKDTFFLRRQMTPGDKNTIPRLTFDSLRDALPLGVRSLGASERSLKFQTETYSIHLSLELSKGHQLVFVIGQLVDATGENKVLDKIPVNLLEDEKALSQTRTNQYGEFQLEYKAFPGMKAYVAIGEAESTLIPLSMISL